MKANLSPCIGYMVIILAIFPVEVSSQILNSIPTVTNPVGQSIYDLQSVGSLSPRVIAWDDGTMAAVWTMGFDDPVAFAFPDRGTGYNYFDGTSWAPIPEARIESQRTGWPSIAKWDTEGEVIVSHHAADQTLVISRRSVKGTGDWQEQTLEGPEGHGYLYPRIATSGANNEYLHVFANVPGSGNGGTSYLGQDGSLLYNRSTDGGQSWDIQHQLLDGIGEDDYHAMPPDACYLTSRGNTVVLITGHKYLDLAMWKSTDNGETWEKTVIWEHPIHDCTLDSIGLDTLYTVDNSASAAIDKNGDVHVVWGITAIGEHWPYPGIIPLFIYQDVDGIGYWNENMPAPIPEAEDPFETLSPENMAAMGMLVGWSPDVDGNGNFHDFEGTEDPPFAVYRQHGVSCMPSIAVWEDFVLIAWASVTETFTTANGDYNYKHIWLSNSYDLGQTWQPFSDVQQLNPVYQNLEGIYPMLVQQQGNFHLFFQSDEEVGLYLDDNHEPAINTFIHIPADVFTGIEEDRGFTQNRSVSLRCHPNPASEEVTLNFELSTKSRVLIKIFDETGRMVMDKDYTGLQAGKQNLPMNISKLVPGVYLVTVCTDHLTSHAKLIIR